MSVNDKIGWIALFCIVLERPNWLWATQRDAKAQLLSDTLSLLIPVDPVESTAMDQERVIEKVEIMCYNSSFHNKSPAKMAAGWGHNIQRVVCFYV